MEMEKEFKLSPDELWTEGDKLYQSGEFEKAFLYFEEAANAGLDKAMYDLGYMYFSGEGTEKSYENAKCWYEKAALKGNVRAMYKLGLFYEQADEFKDFKEAAKWYQKAADENDMYAQCNLGILYYTGLAGEKNKELALALLKQSADQDYDRAKDMLTSIMYREEVLKKRENKE